MLITKQGSIYRGLNKVKVFQGFAQILYYYKNCNKNYNGDAIYIIQNWFSHCGHVLLCQNGTWQ